jgi:ATP synthase F1 epsilon subunit
MTRRLTLDLLTPTGPLRAGLSVDGVELSGILGELGILPDHEALVTAVVPGVLRFREGERSARIAVGSGFLEIAADGQVHVLVDRAVDAGEVDVAAVRARLDAVTRELSQLQAALTDPHHRRLDVERAWLEAQLRAAAA